MTGIFWLDVTLLALGFYLPLAYLFLAPGYLGFMLSSRHPWQEKFVETTGCLMTPFFLPIVFVGWVALMFSKLLLAFGMILLLLASYPLYWLAEYFPFGGVLRKWYELATAVLEWVKKLLGPLNILISKPPKQRDPSLE